jgi:DNA-binding MarR family transcriptional regulator
MPARYFNQKTDISLPQWKILKYIATHDNSDYRSIANELKRTRPTIFQSVKSLLKKGYLDSFKVDPAERNSKVVLRLSRKGKDYIGTNRYLGRNIPISNYDIFSLESDPIVLDYLQILRKVTDSNLVDDMVEELSYHLHSAPIAAKKGKINPEDNISAIKKAFFQGLQQIAQNPDYDLRKLFTLRTIKWLNNIYSLDNRIEMKEYFQRIAQNYETIVKGIAKTLPK